MRSVSASTSDMPWFVRKRFSLVIGVLIAIVVPIILRYDRGLVYFESLQSISTFAANVAGVIFGFMLASRFQRFPGLSAGGIVATAYISAFGIIALMLLFFYVDYSRFIYFTAAIANTAWFVAVNFLRRRYSIIEFAYIPGTKNIDQLDLPEVNLTKLKSPRDFKKVIGAVVADLRAEMSPEWVQFLAECALRDIPVFHIKHAREELTGRVQIESLSENTLGSILPSSLYLNIKWFADTILALLLMPLILLVMAIFLPLLYITQGRPFLYTQQRIGRGGKPFTMIKLRSMLTDDQVANLQLDEQRHSAQTKDDDPRITRLGHFIRRYRIDELPQVINVLKGDMSWIGPRPEAAVLGSMYEEVVPFYRYRYIVRPGISGWAQVNQGHVTDVDEIEVKLQYDFYYVKNISAWLDVLIVLRTLRTILGGFGAR
ncbi:MAG: sugar transferase [Pseudomonadota bacterium]